MPEEPLQVRLEVTDQRSGQYTLTCSSWQYFVTLKPEASITFSEWLRRLRPVLIGHNDPAGSRDPQDLLRNVGTWLWQALLPESAPAQEREALTQALRTGRTPLVLTLPDTLAGLPWELLYDPHLSGDGGFLAHRRPLMRLSDVATSVTPIEPPLRVLLLISSPPGLGEDSRVDVESERVAIEQAVRDMREAGFLHLLVEDIVTPKRVEHLLVRFKPHMVHYIGHGEYNEISGGVLLWEDDQGNELELSASRLAELLRQRNLHAVVLHGCETGRSNARTEVRGLADTLAHEGLSAVLAQQANFTYESSQRASEAWYTALTAGKSFAEALFEVRQALTRANRPDWAVPILQGSIASLVPVFAAASLPGSVDPLLTNVGATADLSMPTTAFVGRHRELRALRLMLENMSGSGPILALITGPGGMGKSALAAQAVTHYGRTYKAALTLRCQGYQGVDLFLQRIGEFLKRLDVPGFLEQTLPDPKLSVEAKIEEAIVALNSAGPVLLVIDNLESTQNEDHTISDKALLHLLQTLLTNLHGGRVLITGRYAVQELLPQENAAKLLHLELNDLSPYETGQLLLRHSPLAQLSEVVRQMLVREFGGLPYVYDLLSSRAAVEDLEQIIYEVREYGTVKQKTITQKRKQRTTEEWRKVHYEVVEFATLEVIISRLSEGSRTLLAQLSVLHQPFPLAAIEEGLSAVQTVWQPLLDWSLLHYDQYEQSYHLHSLTRHYAEGLLEEQARKQTQVQLGTWYEHYARQDSHKIADALEAHRLWRAAGNVQQAGQLVMQLEDGLRQYGLYPLLHNLYAMTLSDTYGINEQLAAASLHGLGTLAYLQGEYKEARGLYQQSLEIAGRLGDQRGRAGSLGQLGMIAQDQGEYREACDLYQQSLDIFEQLRDQDGQAMVLHNLGTIALYQGEYGEARSLYQQSLEIKVRLGDQSGRANSLGQLGMIAQEQGQYEEARSLYQQSLEIKVRLGDQSGRARCLGKLGMIAQEQGQYEEARGLYQQSLDIFEQLRDQDGQARCLHELGIIAEKQGEYEEARSLYRQSLEIKEQLGDQRGRANSLCQLGNLACLQGKYEEARGLYQQSLNIFGRLGDQRGRANTLYQLGVLAYEEGNFENALRYMIQAYILLDALRSPARAFAHDMITRIGSHMDEGTFMTHWRTFAGGRSLVAAVEQEETEDTDEDNTTNS